MAGTLSEAHARLWAVVDHDFVHVHPDQTIDVVLDRLAQSGGVLPVAGILMPTPGI